MDLDEMRELVASAPVGRLATIDPGGLPNLVPFVYALNGDELFSVVDRKPKRTKALQRLENIRRDPRVTVLIDHYEDDWSKLWWVRIRGRARIAEEGEDLARTLRLLVAKYPQYRQVATEEIAIVVTIDEWLGWRS